MALLYLLNPWKSGWVDCEYEWLLMRNIRSRFCLQFHTRAMNRAVKISQKGFMGFADTVMVKN
jgi:hypothetical protein